MKYYANFIIIVLGFCNILTGCAGLHSMPSHNYSETPEKRIVRIFFDQWGNLYPKAPPAIMPTPKFIGTNSEFNIAKFMKDTGQDYSPELIESLYNDYAEQVKKEASKIGTNKVYFLIHGYNNSYDEAKKAFCEMEKIIEEISPGKHIFVEVYWDGLYKGPVSSIVPLAYWFDSMTYSNIAGQVGLRRFLNRLPEGMEITLMTHSRGAGVAFSAFTDPVYDCDISVPRFEEFKKDHFKKVTIISIAPAIGFGHPLMKLKEALPQNSMVLIGFNEHDPALQKSLMKFSVGSKKFGDTSLGVNSEYFLEEACTINTNRKWLQRVKYENYFEHAIDGYLKNTDSTNCLLWAAGLGSKMPDKCTLQRSDAQ